MKVKIKKLTPEAVIPKYAKSGDAGMDLTATEVLIEDYLYITCKTGIAIEIPEGYVGLVFPRSSISKTGLALRNSVGVIDSNYRGEILLKFNTHDPFLDTYKVGDRVGQLMIVPYPKIEFEEVTELSDTERGSGGFGHTGN